MRHPFKSRIAFKPVQLPFEGPNRWCCARNEAFRETIFLLSRVTFSVNYGGGGTLDPADMYRAVVGMTPAVHPRNLNSLVNPHSLPMAIQDFEAPI